MRARSFLALALSAASAFAQEGRPADGRAGTSLVALSDGRGALAAAAEVAAPAANASSSGGGLLDAPGQTRGAADDAGSSGAAPVAAAKAVVGTPDPGQRQPKRILGVMPNYRAVSAGDVAPPPTAREAFVLATQNTFDYSSFVFVGLTSLIAKGEDAHPDLGKGVPGLWAYTWRGFVDKTDGNYLVLFALPTLLREDERYYALGQGRKLHRALYSLDSVFVARDYKGRGTFNAAEILGRGIAQGVSVTYYPSQDSTALEVSEKLGYAVMRDALTNAFREFWPDIATHVLHLKQQ